MTKSISLFISGAIVAVVAIVPLGDNMAFAATPQGELVPTCVASVTPAYITSTQSATLRWDASEGAIFTSIDNGIGPVGVDGVLTVSPAESTIYTIHTWNARGEGGVCTATLIVDGKPVVKSQSNLPNVTLQTLAIQPAATKIVLTQVPYTGATENVLYTLFLLALVLTTGYIAKTHTRLFIA